MGKRGPRPDAAQAEKGYPGRRKAKADAAVADQVKVAKVLAKRPDSKADLPPMIQGAKFAEAAKIWRRLAPELRSTHRLPKEAELSFMQFCIYAQEWNAATKELHARGFVQNVETVAGGKMERRRPQTFDRQQAFQNLMELSGRFGLTPSDMYALFKGQAAVAPSRPDLFGPERQPDPETPEPDQAPSRIGGLSALRSAPPQRMN